jgi:hypothetical protein
MTSPELAPLLVFIVNGIALLLAGLILNSIRIAARKYRLNNGDPTIQDPAMRKILRALMALLTISVLTALANVLIL